MTSNIGASARNVMGFNKDKSLAKNEDLKAFFTPEFRNRLDATVEFQPLSSNVLQGIVYKFIDELNGELKKKKINVTVTDKATKYIVKKSFKAEMGARPLKRYIKENITNKLSDEILFGTLQNGGQVVVDVKNNALINEYIKN